MKSLAKNYFLNLSYQVLVIVLPLITAPYLARVLGPDRIGEYSFAQSIVSHFALFAALGTTLYGQRMIASRHAIGESKKQIFWEIVLLRSINVVIASACYFGTILPFADYPLLYVVAAIEMLAIAFDISWFYQGIEEFQRLTVCNGLSKLVGAAVIFLFVKGREDLVLYVVFLCGSTLLGNAAQWLYIWPYLKEGTVSRLRPMSHLKPAFHLFLSQFAIHAYTVVDKTMLGLITRSNFENGYYDQTQNLIRALVAIVTSIGTVMASRITILLNSSESNKDEQVQDLLLFSFRLIFALSLPIVMGIMLIASRFVPIYYGPDFEPMIFLAQVLVLIVPIIGCSNIIGMQLLVPLGKERYLSTSVMVGAVVNVVLNFAFIPGAGAVGAAAASVMAELTVTGMQIYFARKHLAFGKIIRIFARYLLLTLIVGAIGLAVSHFADTGLIGMAIIIVACVGSYAALLFGLKDPVLKLFKM